MTNRLPETTVTVEAQPWSKDHVAKIASIRIDSTRKITRKKIQTLN